MTKHQDKHVESVLPLVGVPIVRWSLVVEALWMLTKFGFLSRIKGFAEIHSQIDRCPVASVLRAAENHIEDIVKAVTKAAGYYPTTAACLQRSAALTWMLRRRGIPAVLIIGVAQFPFKSHAWVEFNDIVLNDGQRIREHYIPIDRLGGRM